MDFVQSQYIGNRTYLAHGLHIFGEGVVDGLQIAVVEVDVSEVVC
jgi:hypothetical protein